MLLLLPQSINILILSSHKATETSATNTEEAITGKAPVNQFIHGVALADAQFRNVVTPNVDTIFSQVWYDLSEEPMVYELPKTDRFCKVQVLDGWTNTAAVLDKAGAYAITLSCLLYTSPSPRD